MAPGGNGGTPTALARELGHGEGYRYSHDEPDGIGTQDYLGVDREYYRPTDRGKERDLGEYLRIARERRRAVKEASTKKRES